MPNVPIHDPNRGWRIWHVDEIYVGENQPGKYVPNINDLIFSFTTGWHRVVTVDLSTGLSTWIPFIIPEQAPTVPDEGILIGVDIGCQAESFRAYIDTSVVPHVLALDSRLHIYGTTSAYIKVFQGTNLDDNSMVISAMYDNGGTFVGENIPLELVVMPDAQNIAVKTPMVGYTLRQLQDGEVVTAVVYDDAGNVISYSKLLVKNTAFIRTVEANRKYVTSIHLESPFLSETDDRLLEIPINMPVENIPVTGVVTYSDGSEVRLPANSGRFRLYGLDHFVATIVGQQIPLALTYWLGIDEYSYGASPGASMHITETYQATTTEFENHFTVKLYAFPVWQDSISGYSLEFFLYSLSRKFVYYVTPLVTISDMSPAFHPLQYGVKQNLIFHIDMDAVDSCYPHFRHVQTMGITLVSPGNIHSNNWLIDFEPNQTPPYGDGLRANMTFIGVDDWRVNIGSGYNSMEEWTRHVYHYGKPLFNPLTELEAPAPNMFVLRTKTRTYEFLMSQWNDDLQIINDLVDGENVYVEFIHRINENDLQLGMAAFPVRLI